MKLSAYERETIILFNETSEPAEVFTYNKRMIRKLDKLAQKFPMSSGLNLITEQAE